MPIETPHGKLGLRLFKPRSGNSLGSYLHIHGGGWVLVSAAAHDERLKQMADNCALDCISVDYRLAPENPYPAGPDDCELAAPWLLEGAHDLNTNYLTIGGESAGAHLSALTLLRLRDRLGTCAFHAANLTAGVFDLWQTPSSRNWGTERLILATRDMQMFASNYVQGRHNYRDPDVSPLYADLNGMPAGSVLGRNQGSVARRHAANGNAELDVTPGGCHVFQGFPELDIARASNARIDAFLNSTRESLS